MKIEIFNRRFVLRTKSPGFEGSMGIKMGKRVKIIAAVAAIAAIGILIWIYIAFNRKEGDIEAGNPTAVAPEASSPTGAALTPEPTTALAEVTPSLGETVTPDEPSAVPTEDPPTPEPTPTPSPTPSPMPTPTPTPTPEPTPTPAAERGEPEYRFQMGDNVWYEFYENSTMLVVAGTGATWDFGGHNGYMSVRLKENPDWDMAKTIVIEEGITRIGDYALASFYYAEEITIPSTMQSAGSCSFYMVGSSKTTWVNLDFSKIKAEKNSFVYAAGLEDIENSSEFMAEPTPTPTPAPPTPTPAPDPEQPRMCHSYKMGGSATFEFWDNGYLYIKGTGKVDDKGELFTWKYEIYEDITGERYNYAKEAAKDVKAFLDSINYIVVDDGITSIGNYACKTGNIKEVWLPESVKSVGKDSMYTDVLHCYRGGKPVAVTSTETRDAQIMLKALSDPELAERYKVKIEGE